jgi:hypothetical protein
VVREETQTELPAEQLTVLLPIWGNLFSIGSLKRVAFQPGISAYTYRVGEIEHGIVFSDLGQSWTVGHWASDAELLYYQLNVSGICHIVFCHASYVAWSGQRIISASKKVEKGELIRCSGSQIRLIATEPDIFVLEPIFSNRDSMLSDLPDAAR